MENNERIARIKAFKAKQDDEAAAKARAKIAQREELFAQIRALKPRIDALLTVGTACAQNGIPLEPQSRWGHNETYDFGHFISNSYSHLLGFIYCKHQCFEHIGIRGGGVCDYELETDGDYIHVEGNENYVMKRFINEFDTFESKFYEYVDKITASSLE
jgi:hypothetical protein